MLFTQLVELKFLLFAERWRTVPLLILQILDDVRDWIFGLVDQQACHHALEYLLAASQGFIVYHI